MLRDVKLAEVIKAILDVHSNFNIETNTRQIMHEIYQRITILPLFFNSKKKNNSCSKNSYGIPFFIKITLELLMSTKTLSMGLRINLYLYISEYGTFA